MRKLVIAFVLIFPISAQAQQGDATYGKEVYEHWCSPCHAPGGRKHPGTSALEILYKGEKPAVLEERLDLTPELIEFYVRNGVKIMPFFRKTEISDKDLVDMATYLAPR
jgi:mono/diheme cytochrome c family protein